MRLHRLLQRTWLPAAVVIVAVFIVVRIVAAPDQLRSLPELERPWLIAPACLLFSATMLVYIVLWRSVLFSLDPARPSFIDSAAAFTCSWLGRLVPTSAPYVTGNVVLGRRLGHGAGGVAAAMAYLNLFVVLTATVASGVVLASVLRDGPPPFVWAAIAGGAAAILYLIPSSLVTGGLLKLSRFVPRTAALGDYQLSRRSTATACGFALVACVLNGLAFVCVVAAFVPVTAAAGGGRGAAFNIAGAAGVAAVPLPSGIGVREAVLAAILHLVVPLEVAIGSAIVARLITLPVDIALGTAGAAWVASDKRRCRKRREGPRPLRRGPIPASY